MSRRARTVRAGWALADQGLSSVTNLVLSLLVARQVDAEAFGAFGVAFTVYLLVIGATRAVVAEPFLVRCSDVLPDRRREAAALACGTAVVIGLGVGTACVITGFVAESLAAPFWMLGICLPGLLVQDTVRHVLFAASRPRAATGNDAVWALALMCMLVPVLRWLPGSVGALTLAWGAAGCVAAAVGIVQVGTPPHPGRAGSWLRAHRDLLGGFLGEFAVRNGARYLTTLTVATVAGLTALGGLRGAQVLFGPLNVVLLAVPLIAIPEAVHLRGERPDRFWPALRLLSIGLAGLGLAAGLAALAIPDALGVALLGDTWVETRPVLVPQALFMASIGAVAGYVTGLRVLAAPTESLVARAVMLPVGVVAGVAGAVLGGAAGATSGMALANWLAVAVWHVQFHRAHDRARGAASTAAALSPLAADPQLSPPSPGR